MKFQDDILPGGGFEIDDLHLLFMLFGVIFLIDALNGMAWAGFALPRNFMRKISCVKRGWQHLIFSNISAWKPKQRASDPNDYQWPEAPASEIFKTQRRIIFIRHGESDWNKVFNRGIDRGKTLFRMLFYPIFEMLKFPMADSHFFDSPLSDLGRDQCEELAKFVGATQDIDMSQQGAWKRDAADLRGEPGTRSVIVTSQLRRAVSTTTIGLWPRLKRTGERVLLLSSLMEQSRNFDCVPLSVPHEVPPLPDLADRIDEHPLGWNMFDPSGNTGDKPIRSKEKGFKRMEDFIEFCFQPELEGTTIIAVGHSLYYKRFFNCFLPHDLASKAKDCKLHNAAAVGLTLQRQKATSHNADNKYVYRIKPNALCELHPLDKAFKT
jgi:broad specificity phosphatase PhoE